MLSSSDARSANSTDATYRTSYTLDAFGDVLTATTPKPAGQTAAPVTTNTISLGTETAADTSTVPVGLLLKTVGPRGEVTTYAYNHNGDLASRTDPSGLRTTYTYDGWGRQTIVSTYSGTTPIGTTSTTYDATGHPLVVTYPATTDVVTGKAHQLRVTNTYDNDGNLLSAARPTQMLSTQRARPPTHTPPTTSSRLPRFPTATRKPRPTTSTTTSLLSPTRPALSRPIPTTSSTTC